MSRELPSGWKLATLNEICAHIARGDAPKYAERITGIWALGQRCIRDEGIDRDFLRPHSSGKRVKEQSILQPGDVCINSTGTGTLGRVGFWPGSDEDVVFADTHITVLRANEREALPRFLFEWLRSAATRQRIYMECVTGSTNQIELSRSSLMSLSLVLPPLHEQRRIAEILSSVDEAIAATRAVIEQTRKVKQGVLERLLTKGIGHTRFKQTEIGEIPEGWEVVQVSNVAASIDSGWSPDCEKVAAGEGEWGILKTSAVVWDGYQPHENKKLPHSLAPRPEIEVKAGDVLITRAGPVDRTGVVALVKNTQRKLMLSDKIIRIQTNADKCVPGFLSLWLSSPPAQNEIVRKKSGMAQSQTNISQKALRELFVPLPPPEEQVEIANAVQSVDDGISAESAKLDALIVSKVALMSDLLTGRKRVTDALPMAAE